MPERPEYQALAAYTPASWAGLADSLDRWAQGYLLGPLPLGWVAPPGVDPVTNLSVDDEGRLLLTVAPSDATQAIITSQTCDVVASGPGARHPFVQVSPVVEVPAIDPAKLEALRKGQVVDLVALQPPGRADTAPPLVADLRISIPVSKAVLVGLTPEPAFDDEHGYLDFARKLAVKVERPALHDFVTGEARSLIREAISRDSRTNTAWWTQVEEVRVLCLPTRLHPTHLEFVVVSRGGPLPPAQMDAWKRLVETVRKAAKPHGIKVRLPMHETEDALRATTYRRSTALDLPELRRPPDAY